MREKIAILLIAGLAAGVAACDYTRGNSSGNTSGVNPVEQPMAESQKAQDMVNDAVRVVRDMKSDPALGGLLEQAKGVFIAPYYGKGAAVVGGHGGEGVLLARESGGWSSPVFYDFGGISVGPQLGGSGGSIAMLLMTDQALNSFKGDNTFSLDASAGFQIFDYTTQAKGTLGQGDVIMWSDTEGAFVGASLGANDIKWDRGQNRAYYGRQATAGDILSGKLSNPESGPLQRALAS